VRLTGADQEFEAEAVAFADGPPEVAHLLPATVTTRSWPLAT
jgi:hypothetical protein